MEQNNEKLLYLGKKIGNGAFGDVYECVFKMGDTCRFGSAKISKELDYEFVKETYISAKLSHHPTVLLYSDAILTEKGHPVLLTDFVGKPLKTHVRRSFSVISEFICRLFQSLFHLHAGGFIHCDIKPQNILYDDNLRYFKLIDFGISQPIRKNINRQYPVVTSYYRPLEAYSKIFGGYWETVDSWSSAVMLLEIITMGKFIENCKVVSDDSDGFRTWMSILKTILGVEITKETIETHLDLRTLKKPQKEPMETYCEKLREKYSSADKKYKIPSPIYEMICDMLDPNPATRMTIENAIHFLRDRKYWNIYSDSPSSPSSHTMSRGIVQLQCLQIKKHIVLTEKQSTVVQHFSADMHFEFETRREILDYYWNKISDKPSKVWLFLKFVWTFDKMLYVKNIPPEQYSRCAKMCLFVVMSVFDSTYDCRTSVGTEVDIFEIIKIFCNDYPSEEIVIQDIYGITKDDPELLVMCLRIFVCMIIVLPTVLYKDILRAVTNSITISRHILFSDSLTEEQSDIFSSLHPYVSGSDSDLSSTSPNFKDSLSRSI